MSPRSNRLTRMQGRSPTDDKQIPSPYACAECYVPNDIGSSAITRPRSTIQRLLPFAVGGSPKVTERFISAKRKWSFATRFTPSGPDTFYLSAAPETQRNSTEHARFANEELPLQFGKISVCDTHPQVTALQGSPLSESWIATIMQGISLPDPNPTLLPVATDRDCTQNVYPDNLSPEIYQLYPSVDFFANHTGVWADQSHCSDMDLDTEMDDIDIAMGVDYNPVSVNDTLLSSTALPVIPYAAPPEPPFPTQSFFGTDVNHDVHVDSSIANGLDPFYSTSSKPIPPDSNEPGDTEDDGGIFVAPDNVPHRRSLEESSTIALEENERDSLCTPQKASPPLAVLETCRAPLIPRQYQPAVYKQELDDADTDVDTEDEGEPHLPCEREATEPLEEGEAKPPAAFLRFDQGVSTGSLEDSLGVPALPPQQIFLSTEHDSQGLKSSVHKRTSFRQEGQEKLAVLHAEAERLLDTLERKLCHSPQVPQQIMPSAADEDESAKPFERETTEPLEDGEDQTPAAFLSYEQRTDAQSSAVHEDRLEPFERETTEPLEEGENQTPVVFRSYEQRITAGRLGDNNVDAHSLIPNSADDENEPDQSLVRESTEPLEDGRDKPPAAFMTPDAILEQRVVTQSTAPSTLPTQIVHFSPIQSQPESQPSYNIPHGNRRLVLNKHGRPIRPLSREKLKRTLGGAPCDLSSLVNTTPWAPSGTDTGYDGDEREDRTDPSKRARCDDGEVPADRGGNKQVRFSGSRRAHFHNAAARFAARSQGPTTLRRPILRSTDNETQLSASPSRDISLITPSSGAVSAALQLCSLPPSTPQPRTKPRSSIGPRISEVVEMTTELDTDIEPPRKLAHLLVDELDRKHRRAPHHPPIGATGGAVRHTRRSHREDWIHDRRRRCCPTEDSLRFLGEQKKQKRKGPLSGIGVRFKLPDIEPVGA